MFVSSRLCDKGRVYSCVINSANTNSKEQFRAHTRIEMNSNALNVNRNRLTLI
jgi:hypothetical protein